MSLIASAREFISGDSPTGREATIDIIRGLCIVSMTFAHLAIGGIGDKITHAAIWFDGAMGFVLLSGLIIGVVQHKTISRGRLWDGQLKVLRRTRLIYGCHVMLCVIALVLATASLARDDRYASVSDLGGVWGTIWAIGTLQVSPPMAAVLSLYVVLMLLTPLASAAAVRGWWWIIAIAIVVLFALGHLFPTALTLPWQPGQPGELNWAAWQAIYFTAFVVGWHWSSVRPWLTTWRVWIPAAAIAGGTVLYARATRETGRPDWVMWAFGSGQMGAGTVVLAFAVIAAGFPIIVFADRYAPRLTGMLARIGRRSLDCYVILAIIVLIFKSLVVYDMSSRVADLGTAGVIVLMWGWCRIRDARPTLRSSNARQ